ncbi:MAG: hypothetical protein KIS86_14360 [Devosia sp.]|nr:hypothetical protein [Devosia sp.]
MARKKRHLIWLVPVMLASVVFVLWSQLQTSPPEPRQGILAGENLDGGRYALVYSFGADMPNAPELDGQAWLVDDHELIARHRDSIDIGFSFVDFLPGERGERSYLYIFRDGVKVGGRLVSRNDQIVLPDQIRDAAQLVQTQAYSGNRADTLSEQRNLLSMGALVDTDNSPDPQAHTSEFYFYARLPTIAALDGAGFDLDAYIETVEQRIRAEAPQGEFDLEVSSAWERPPGTVYFIGPDNWTRATDAGGGAAGLGSVWLYDLRIDIIADPELYAAFAEIDLHSLVADQLNRDVISRQYMSAMGTSDTPESLVVESYRKTGFWSALTERQYGFRYWRQSGA